MKYILVLFSFIFCQCSVAQKINDKCDCEIHYSHNKKFIFDTTWRDYPLNTTICFWDSLVRVQTAYTFDSNAKPQLFIKRHDGYYEKDIFGSIVPVYSKELFNSGITTSVYKIISFDSLSNYYRVVKEELIPQEIETENNDSIFIYEYKLLTGIYTGKNYPTSKELSELSFPYEEIITVYFSFKNWIIRSKHWNSIIEYSNIHKTGRCN